MGILDFLKRKKEESVHDVFRPRMEPARTIYDAFQEEAKKREGREVEEWKEKEAQAVWKAARDYAEQNGLRIPTLIEVKNASNYASGSVDYGAKWAYQLRDYMEKKA